MLYLKYIHKKGVRLRSSIKRVLPVIKGRPGSYRVDGMKRQNIKKDDT